MQFNSLHKTKCVDISVSIPGLKLYYPIREWRRCSLRQGTKMTSVEKFVRKRPKILFLWDNIISKMS